MKYHSLTTVVLIHLFSIFTNVGVFASYPGELSLKSLPTRGEFSAKNRVFYYPDTTSNLTIEEVVKLSESFRPVLQNIPQFGKNQAPHWIHTPIINSSIDTISLIAEIDYPFLDIVQFYLVDSLGHVVQKSASLGWSKSTKLQDDNHRNPLFNFTIPGQATYQLFVLASAGPNRLSIPLRLWSVSNFKSYDRFDRTFWGWINGVFFCIVFFGALLCFFLGKRLYCYYALYAVTSWCYLLSIDGFFLEWIDGSSYGIVSALDFRHLCTTLQAITSTLFIRSFILDKLIQIRFVFFAYRFSLTALSTNVLLICLNNFFPDVFRENVYLFTPWVSFNFISPVIIIVGLILIVAFSPRYRQSLIGQSARMYLLSVSPLILITLVSMPRNYNLIADHILLRAEGTALAMFIEFLILSIVLGYRYKRVEDEQRYFAEQAHQQQQLASQAQLKLRQEEIKTLEAQLKLQNEKERIARDLHDHVGSQLSVIASSLNFSPETSPSWPRISTIGNYARDAIQSLRDTIWAIHQEKVSLIEFKIKLQQHIDRLQPLFHESKLLFYNDFDRSDSLSSLQALNLFRITQEALNNAIKYSKASHISITVKVTSLKVLLIEIEDDGIGFELKDEQEGPHYGLMNIQYRATEIGASCQILSVPGQGTKISILMPMEFKNT